MASRKCGLERCSRMIEITSARGRPKKFCCEAHRKEHGQMMRMKPSAVRAAREEKQRRCLKCQDMFSSKGPSNRICPVCDQSNRNVGRVLDDRFMGA